MPRERLARAGLVKSKLPRTELVFGGPKEERNREGTVFPLRFEAVGSRRESSWGREWGDRRFTGAVGSGSGGALPPAGAIGMQL